MFTISADPISYSPGAFHHIQISAYCSLFLLLEGQFFERMFFSATTPSHYSIFEAETLKAFPIRHYLRRENIKSSVLSFEFLLVFQHLV